MLSNEQRAHDLAIAILAQHVQLKYFLDSPKDNKIEINYLDEYLELYNSALKSFRQHYPDNG